RDENDQETARHDESLTIDAGETDRAVSTIDDDYYLALDFNKMHQKRNSDFTIDEQRETETPCSSNSVPMVTEPKLSKQGKKRKLDDETELLLET
uniref:Uncharacterized protein n=1 Tax=Romanomermis culicivorax TaxID=13658 RepID=A0A915JDN6_ROMCU